MELTKTKADYVPVPEFYAGKSVFITGGTGFLGKVLVEKLLRSCPGIKNIYLLMRSKREQNIQCRLDELLSTPLFDMLRHERPNDLKKIIPIFGDMMLEALGISESDQELLCQTVSVVFHSAATVNFNEKLKFASTINTLGTKRIINLCHRMVSLEALVHVSTAYCNSDRSEVSEIIYAPPYNPNDIISLAECLPEDLLNDLTPSLIGKHPNTYTFTKALAENILMNEDNKLPLAIVRPSIVLSSVNEPLPGWLDNAYGPTYSMILNGIGVLKVLPAVKTKIVDIIPVDIVTNLLIASAWKLATTRSKNLIVFNCVSGNSNAITWGSFISLCTKYLRKHALENAIYYPYGLAMYKEPYYTIFTFFLHTVPVYLENLVVWSIKGKKIFGKTLSSYGKVMKGMTYFTSREWMFKDENVRKLLKSMSSDDKKLFNFDITELSWEDYLEHYILGIRIYYLKQSFCSLAKSRKKLQILYWINIAILFALVGGLFYSIYFIIN